MAVDPAAMRSALASALGAHGLPGLLAETHPNLFATLPVHVSRQHIHQVEQVVAAVDAAAELTAYRAAVLGWAPQIARFDPGSPGGMLGLDFHVTPDGPKLIEINTNPGGVLLNALVGQAQRLCMPDVVGSPTDIDVEKETLAIFLREWRVLHPNRPLATVAIVDDAPTKQYLYPEFLLFCELFKRSGIQATINDPRELTRHDGRLWCDDRPIDLVYNRLTDFSLAQTAHEAIRDAYLAAEIVLTPHPMAHALYADKRNLILLGDRDFLSRAGLDEATTNTLSASVPRTIALTAENREELWAKRRGLFFKPAAGFGSKASYRGDKITRRVWDEMANTAYIAQDFVLPGERHIAFGEAPLKADIRCYAYRGQALLYAARLYQGQTTNFRTPGGGFAPVLTDRQRDAPRSEESARPTLVG